MRLYVKIGTMPGERVERLGEGAEREPAEGEIVTVRRPEPGRKPFRARCYRIVHLSNRADDKLFCLELI